MKGAIQCALEVYKDKYTLNAMRKSAMESDFSWKESAKKYLALYNHLFFVCTYDITFVFMAKYNIVFTLFQCEKILFYFKLFSKIVKITMLELQYYWQDNLFLFSGNFYYRTS